MELLKLNRLPPGHVIKEVKEERIKS